MILKRALRLVNEAHWFAFAHSIRSKDRAFAHYLFKRLFIREICKLWCVWLFVTVSVSVFFLALTSNLLSFEQINGNTNKKNVPFSCTQTTETSKTHVIFQGCVGRIYEYKSRGIIYFQLILKQSFQKNQKHKIWQFMSSLWLVVDVVCPRYGRFRRSK